MPRARPEAQLQKAVVRHLTLLENTGALSFFSVPNEGKRKRTTGHHMRLMGMRSGVPDLVVLIAGGRPLFWELKAAKNDLTEAQEGWAKWLAHAGYDHAVIRSLDDVAKALAPHSARAA